MAYSIPLNGWAAGERKFRWQADYEFFQTFGNQEILDATVDVQATAVRSGSGMDVDLDIQGHVTVACDRCLEEVALPVEAHPRFIVKFGPASEASNACVEGEECEPLVLDPSDTEVDLRQAIYDFVCLSLPMQRVHPEGGCNAATIRFLSQGPKDEVAEKNSPFAGLKGLFNE